MTLSSQARTVVLATGGTGGHIFPAEALAECLLARGYKVHVITDRRFEHYMRASNYVLGSIPTHVIDAASMSGSLMVRVKALVKNIIAYRVVRKILSEVRPNVVVGFGGYPSFPTLCAAAGRIPTIIHEQNSILGKANRVLASRVDVIATSFEETGGIKLADRTRVQCIGNPVRAAIQSLRAVDYPTMLADGILHVLVTGGSQGAAILGDVVPKAVALLPAPLRKRVRIDQQVRAEQLEGLRAEYEAIGVHADLAPFFADIPNRLASAHLVIARAGASTICELTTAGRPAILVPLPSAADDHQKYNAKAIDDMGGGWLMPQNAFTPEALAAKLEYFLTMPHSLAKAAASARALGKPEAAEHLADLVERVARLS
ncbi:MAG: undecaprenyldiphospho-muramoylpentapeptide beta-N-acetylglucosaminyltransferase [Alphaproteobacteria bacterium]|nr:MAG: undecaprenyldiphospho-muramoylpentapeptide beta-N-acetylglucosaminyltransferase [Alphaproteobacteria bacterium]